MAEFLVTEAIDVDSVDDDNSEGNNNTATVSDDEFIDDTPQENNDFYPYFTNVSRSYDDAMRDFENINDLEARNYFDTDEEEEEEINEFSNFEAKVKLFKESLINPHGLENPDSFFILFCMQFAIS